MGIKEFTSLIDVLQQHGVVEKNNKGFIFLKNGNDEGKFVSYKNLDKRAKAIAAYLKKEGLIGERALILYPPGLEYIEAFFGCLYAGVIAVPAFPPTNLHYEVASRYWSRLAHIVQDSEAKIVLAKGSLNLYAKVMRLIHKFPPELSRLKWISSECIPSFYSRWWEKGNINSNSIAFLQYTSGSIGDPKGVIVSHGNLLTNLEWMHRCMGATVEYHGLTWLPPYHDMGLIGGILYPIYAGFQTVIMSPIDFLKKPLRWLELASKYKVNIIVAPNFAFELCVTKATPEFVARINLSHCEVAIIGAEPVRSRTLSRFVETFSPCGFRQEAFCPAYGLAESTLLASWNNTPRKLHSIELDSVKLQENKAILVDKKNVNARTFIGCGTFPEDGMIKIVNSQTLKECAEGDIGEVWLSSPCVAQGYWRKPVETEKIFNARLSECDGCQYLRTGDLGFLINRQLYIAGREKEVIIIRGKNYYPSDIEDTVVTTGQLVRAGSCIAFSFEKDHEEHLVVVSEVKVFLNKIISHEESAGELAQIREAIIQQHGIRPSAIVFVSKGAIPKTSSGKLRRRETCRRYLEKKFDVVFQWDIFNKAEMDKAPVNAKKDLIEEEVISLIAKEGVISPEEIELNLRLRDQLGLDSLMLFDLQAEIENRYPKIDASKLKPDMTVGDLIKEVRVVVKKYGHTPWDSSLSKAKEKQWDLSDNANYDFRFFPEVIEIENRFKKLAEEKLPNPYFKIKEGISRDVVTLEGKEVIHFSGYNYLGLSGDQRVTQAAIDAIHQYGTSVSASRLVSGEIPVHLQLEAQIAQFVGVEDCIVYVGGHGTNVSTIGHLMRGSDLILHDELAHDSLIQGSIHSGATRKSFPHNDYEALNEILNEMRSSYRRVLICIEGVYSMDGDIPELPKFIELKEKYKALLYVDEAHSIGVLGKSGRGIAEHFNVDAKKIDLLMGTLSKSLASCGGYIAGCKKIINYLKYTSPGFVYSVGMSPANAAAALASLKVLKEETGRLRQLRDNSKLFLSLAREKGLNTGLSQDTPIIPIIIGDSVQCILLSKALQEQGINSQPILYPAVAEDMTRLRFFITSSHTEAQIRKAIDVLTREIGKLHDRAE